MNTLEAEKLMNEFELRFMLAVKLSLIGLYLLAGTPECYGLLSCEFVIDIPDVSWTAQFKITEPVTM